MKLQHFIQNKKNNSQAISSEGLLRDIPMFVGLFFVI